MRITKYKLELNEEGNSILIKEFGINYNGNNLNEPEEVVKMLNELFKIDRLAEEYVYMIALNKKCKVLGVFEISHGTVDSASIRPREIFIRALLVGASCIIISHNHPSGSCEPSNVDLEVTENIMKCASMIGVTLLDHIIVGDGYKSLKFEGLM